MGRATLFCLVACALSCTPRPGVSPPRSAPARAAAPAPRGVVELASGSEFFCARFASGKVACYRQRDGAIDLSSPELLDVTDAKKILATDSRLWVQHDGARWTPVVIESSYVVAAVEPTSAAPLVADGVACAQEADGGVSCVFSGKAEEAPTRVRLPDAKSARDLVLIRRQEPWLCGRTENRDLSCWSMSGKTAKAASSVSRVWGGERLCIQQVDGLLSCLRDDASLDAKLAWDPIRRYPQLQDVATGSNIGCAQVDDRHVECWWWQQHWDDHVDAGMTYAGELRGEPTPVVALGRVVSLSVGGGHACAIEASGKLSCWGRVGPVEAPAGPRVTRLPFTSASAIAIGSTHACAIQNQRAWCWGDNRWGQLGQSTSVRALQTPAPMDVGAVAELALGDRHTCLRTQRGTVLCYGDPADGRLGRKAGQSPFVARVSGIEGAVKLAASGDLTCAIDGKGSVSCWGRLDGKHGTAGPVAIAELSGASDVSIDRRFICALIGESVRCKERNRRSFARLTRAASSSCPAVAFACGTFGCSASTGSDTNPASPNSAKCCLPRTWEWGAQPGCG